MVNYETFAEERTRVVREERFKRDTEYREKNNISPTQIYYHEEENMWRPDYIVATITE